MTRRLVDPSKRSELVTGPWTLSDLNAGRIGSPKNGLNMFSCFHCGGGSSMGYKLAGYNVIGGVEVDPRMVALYRKNFLVEDRLSFPYPIQDMAGIRDEKLPREMFELDVLDGSPPCSSFSMAGSREKAWGKEKKFREGQSMQVLDDLFFHYIDLARRLRPKIVVAENVKGLVAGKARGYVKQIFAKFREAGYQVQLFLLNSSRMGVPQARERTFFICRRMDLPLSPFKMEFVEALRSYSSCLDDNDDAGKSLSDEQSRLWSLTMPGQSLAKAHPKGNMFTWTKLNPDKPANTATSGPAQLSPFSPAHINDFAQRRIQSFPEDYDFNGEDVRYVCGMSVPPLMMQRISSEIAAQLLPPKL